MPADAGHLTRLQVAIETHLLSVLEQEDYTSASIKLIWQVPAGIRERQIADQRAYGALWRKLLEDARKGGAIRADVDLSVARMAIVGALNWAADWYKPSNWFVMGKGISATRLLTFVGREVPDILKPAYSFGGLALSQMCRPYVENWINTRQAVADIVKAYSIFVLSTKMTDALAEQGDAARFDLPRPMLHSGDLDFSFSGLKTAVLTRVKAAEKQGSLDEQTRADLSAATQAAIVDVLAAKSIKALKQTGLKRLVVAGGVGANSLLRSKLARALEPLKAQAYFPPLALCTDNGAMIAFAAAERVKHGLASLEKGSHAFTVRPRWDLADICAA